VLLAGKRGVAANAQFHERRLEAGPFPEFGIDPHVAVAVHDPTRPEVVVDLQQNVLRVGFKQDAPFPHELGPTFENGNHDLLDHECFGLGAQFLNQLDD